jgi:lipopolysaccharide heptosyltransferase II
VKILVRATNWVGDAVMSLPALRAIRGRWPEAEIAVLARPWVAELYRHQQCADRLLVYDHRGRHGGFWGRERLARELRAARFDTAVLLQNAFEAAWLAWRARIPERIGYARDRRSWLLTRAVAVPVRGEVPPHQSYYYLELLRRVGWIERLPAVDAIALRVPEEVRREAEQKLLAAGARPGATRIAFAPGATYGSAKCWLPERYAALADGLIAAADADVILFGAPPEREMAERIARSMQRRAVNLAGATSIGELPGLLRACRLFVGNDSGAMHVAAAVGLPVVGIFGPTDPEATRPASPQFTLVREPVSCSPCLLRHCPIDHRCMTRISVEQVLGVARALLARPADAASREVRSAGIV